MNEMFCRKCNKQIEKGNQYYCLTATIEREMRLNSIQVDGATDVAVRCMSCGIDDLLGCLSVLAEDVKEELQQSILMNQTAMN